MNRNFSPRRRVSRPDRNACSNERPMNIWRNIIAALSTSTSLLISPLSRAERKAVRQTSYSWLNNASIFFSASG